MDMARVFGNPRLLRTSTTLGPLEFACLEAALGAARQEGRRAQTHEGRERRRQPGDGFLDGTERSARRPQDPDRQRADHSGKKETHSKKNLLVTGGGRVLYVSPTAPGSVHDKKLADEAGLCSLPGFQTWQPAKKPWGRVLHPLQKQINTLISQVHIPVEHAIAAVKRCRVVFDTVCNWAKGLVGRVMLAACGLHNLRAATRQAA